MEFPDLIRPARLGMPAQPLLVESVAAVSSTADVTKKLEDLSVAQRYLAIVETRLANGSFKVLVNGQDLQMNLPESAKPGDQLNLLLLSKDPRLKFALLSVTTATSNESSSVAQRFLVNVRSQLPNGNFNVQINGQDLQLRLPEGTRPGDQLKLLVDTGELNLKSGGTTATNLETGITQKFLVNVKEQLPNGNFAVLIDGQDLQLHLPQNTRPGSRLELVLIGRDLNLKSGDAQAAGTSAGVELSKTGRFLGALTQDAARALATPLTNTTPLLATSPINQPQFPALLQQAMAHSGLFYESHQAQWIAGKRPLEQLLKEPQSRLGATASSSNASSPESMALSEVEPTATGILRSADTPVHAQSLTLVQQQLNVLETGQLTWRGEVWPGQPVTWDITQQPSPGNETTESPRWQTRLRLTLPKLGEIIATIGFDTRGVQIALNARDAETLVLMQNDRQPLAAAMETAGLNVLGVEVQRDNRE